MKTMNVQRTCKENSIRVGKQFNGTLGDFIVVSSRKSTVLFCVVLHFLEWSKIWRTIPAKIHGLILQLNSIFYTLPLEFTSLENVFTLAV